MHGGKALAQRFSGHILVTVIAMVLIGLRLTIGFCCHEHKLLSNYFVTYFPLHLVFHPMPALGYTHRHPIPRCHGRNRGITIPLYVLATSTRCVR